jgi:peptidyl-prolyl cis-trans isomerase SurA
LKKIITLALVFTCYFGYAQKGKVLEEIVAVVGDNVVLKTDLETEYLQAKQTMDFFDGDLKCEILNQLIVQKLYLHKGDLDSVVTSQDRVDAEVDRRVQYYAAQIGGEQKLEKYLGKSIAEYKLQMRPKVYEQMIIQQVQQGLIANVKISPTEVSAFFNRIPKDSLPELETEVEVGLIAMQPKPNKVAKEFALRKITEIREDLLAGKYTFSYAAKSMSDDKGTAVNGGELGYFGRGQMVGPFERIAFKLKNDTISDIIETEFGYHILQLIDRKGEKVNVRHILIKPLIVTSDYVNLVKQMKATIDDLKSEETNMCEASKLSIDPYTKDNCGFFTDQTTGSQLVSIKTLDPDVAAAVENMKVGTYSQPAMYYRYDQSKAYRFFYLKNLREAHIANMKDDYQKIQNLAKEEKQNQVVEDWIEEYKNGVYIWIDDKYRNCSELSGWKNLSN